MAGAWWKLSGGYGRCEDVRVDRCVQSGFVLPHGRVCFGQGESPVKLFAKLFGKSAREGSENATARHRAQPQEAERPLFRDQVAGGDVSGGQGASSVDPAGSGRIGFGDPSTSGAGGGFGSDPYASQAPGGQPRQEDPSMSALVCSRCGNRNAENSRFCSNCGAPLRAGAVPERPSETTSTISISGLEAYDSETTGQTQMPMLSPEAQAAVDALPLGSALLVVRRGPNSGSRFLLDSELTTAGRHPQSDIFLDDVTVSRRHVEFRRTPEGTFTVADVGSLNGTYVNRERIDQVALANGDEVQIGKYRLVFYASQRGI
ncbi:MULTISPECIES: FHA domain-containing protein [Streptomyces]|uniref:FHA domain-containing protein n=2 Tax=Streptomyces griseoaurantiacus TaxID=68213 RepID=A0A7W2HUI3_9ACTN|nr:MULTISPECIES: FHA domain-containing protein [Streptomyces]MBA5222068.1 FHA domain-containing protein [Streptomyces griseoaurantiacus]MDX3088410.1 FHA domain-containing protein [Streptomyces sp. ME12-02E]MDX3331741.1 FHA domain-containing protein [Streptomyces sp. ME02-6978a]MDX3358479.1 FHA domain-containing protein [Streptomyces sp. ME02-6978.2a]WTI25782.1 zinc-ribbon and FHA domain-containing protein [Streptomyces jietaisiensis]